MTVNDSCLDVNPQSLNWIAGYSSWWLSCRGRLENFGLLDANVVLISDKKKKGSKSDSLHVWVQQFIPLLLFCSWLCGISLFPHWHFLFHRRQNANCSQFTSAIAAHRVNLSLLFLFFFSISTRARRNGFQTMNVAFCPLPHPPLLHSGSVCAQAVYQPAEVSCFSTAAL